MKKFGIRITLPEGNTLRSPHLLGDDWADIRWYASAEARDQAFTEMQRQPENYRKGDTIQHVLNKVEKN